MDVKEFFEKAKAICNKNYDDCRECPITDYCCDGIFTANKHEAAEIVAAIEDASN